MSAKPDLVFLCDWLPPDFGAVGQYSLLRARELAAAGRSVVLYGLSSSADSREESPSLAIVRIKTPVYDRGSFLQRAWWTLATDLRLVWRSLADLRGAKEILFTGSPPFLLHLLGPLNLLLGKTLVYRITDFYPEVMIADKGRAGPLMALLLALTRFWRRRVHRFEVLGEDAKRRLVESGVPRERVEVRRDPSPVVIGNAVPLENPLPGKIVLLYSGNFGVAHDHETLVAGYIRHHREGSGRVGLWINATGSRADLAERMLREAGVPFHRSRPVPLEELARLLVTPHAHLITLREAFSGYVLPSKVHGCIASGKPIVYIGPRSSDVHLLCMALPRYWQADAGNAAAVHGALEELGAQK